MRKLVHLILALGGISLAVACASSQESSSTDIPATVEYQVRSTVAAVPTATHYPTYTPYPTIAPQPQLTAPPELTLDDLVELTFACMQDNPSTKAGFIAGMVAEQPGSEELANLLANDFEVYQSVFLSGGADAEVRAGLELMHSTCLTFAK